MFALLTLLICMKLCCIVITSALSRYPVFLSISIVLALHRTLTCACACFICLDSTNKQPWYMMLDALLSFIEKSPQVSVLLSELLVKALIFSFHPPFLYTSVNLFVRELPQNLHIICVVCVVTHFLPRPFLFWFTSSSSSSQKSIWNQSILLLFSCCLVQNFIGGLVLFSELLPLPLPIVVSILGRKTIVGLIVSLVVRSNLMPGEHASMVDWYWHVTTSKIIIATRERPLISLFLSLKPLGIFWFFSFTGGLGVLPCFETVIEGLHCSNSLPSAFVTLGSVCAGCAIFVQGARPSTVKELLSHRQVWRVQLKMHEDRLQGLILRLSGECSPGRSSWLWQSWVL